MMAAGGMVIVWIILMSSTVASWLLKNADASCCGAALQITDRGNCRNSSIESEAFGKSVA
jgi:hypothetical protein